VAACRSSSTEHLPSIQARGFGAVRVCLQLRSSTGSSSPSFVHLGAGVHPTAYAPRPRPLRASRDESRKSEHVLRCGMSAATWRRWPRPRPHCQTTLSFLDDSGLAVVMVWEVAWHDTRISAAPACSGYVSASSAPHLDGDDRLCGRRRSRRLQRAPAMDRHGWF